MAYVKKISDDQFYLDVVNKELEIAGGPQFDSWDELCHWSKLNKDWFCIWAFDSKEQFLEFKEYYYNHFYDWKPKRYTKRERNQWFSMFMFNYGLKTDFEYEYKELYDD